MSRLTELIDIDGMKIKTSKERPLSKQGLGAILHKLYALEDLEDDLGCPLDVLFKALSGIYCPEFEENEEIKHYYVYGFNKHNLFIRLVYDKNDNHYFLQTSHKVLLRIHHFQNHYHLCHKDETHQILNSIKLRLHLFLI